MGITVIATVMIMLAYFLLLYGAVGFIQDKRFFSSAPAENLVPYPRQKREIPRCARARLGDRGDSCCAFYRRGGPRRMGRS